MQKQKSIFDSLLADLQSFDCCSCLDERNLKIVQLARNRKCHSCGRQIEKGERAATLSTGSQSSFNICNDCMKGAYETISSSDKKEEFRFSIGDKVVLEKDIEKKQGVVPHGMEGVIKQQITGDSYIVEFPAYYDPTKSETRGEVRAALSFHSTARLINSKIEVKISGRNLSTDIPKREKAVLKKTITFDHFPGVGGGWEGPWKTEREAMADEGRYPIYHMSKEEEDSYYTLKMEDMSEEQQQDVRNDLKRMKVKFTMPAYLAPDILILAGQMNQKVIDMLQKNHGFYIED